MSAPVSVNAVDQPTTEPSKRFTQSDAVMMFRTAYESFVPEPSDNPDCIPFYRTWHGARAVFGAEFLHKFNSEMHDACCWASSERDVEKSFQILCSTLADRAEKITLPERPRDYSSYWNVEPKEPAEADARNLFVDEFRLAFPGERANSKHANELWKSCREKAAKVVQEQYERSLETYRAAEAAESARRANVEAEWSAKCAAVQAYIDEVTDALLRVGMERERGE